MSMENAILELASAIRLLAGAMNGNGEEAETTDASAPVSTADAPKRRGRPAKAASPEMATPAPVAPPAAPTMPPAPFVPPVAPAAQAVPSLPPFMQAPVAPAASSAPFTTGDELMSYVLATYKALGPDKGAAIQGIIVNLGYSAISEIRPEHYGDFYARCEALKS